MAHVKFTVSGQPLCLPTRNNFITPCVLHHVLTLLSSRVVGKRRLEMTCIAASMFLNVLIYIQLARHWTIAYLPIVVINIGNTPSVLYI